MAQALETDRLQAGTGGPCSYYVKYEIVENWALKKFPTKEQYMAKIRPLQKEYNTPGDVERKNPRYKKHIGPAPHSKIIGDLLKRTVYREPKKEKPYEPGIRP